MIFIALGDAWTAERQAGEARAAYARAELGVASLGGTEALAFAMRIGIAGVSLEAENGSQEQLRRAALKLATSWMTSDTPRAALRFLTDGPDSHVLGEGTVLYVPALRGESLHHFQAAVDALSGDEHRAARGAMRFLMAAKAYVTNEDAAALTQSTLAALEDYKHPLFLGMVAVTALIQLPMQGEQAGSHWARYLVDGGNNEVSEPLAVLTEVADEDLAAFAGGLLAAALANSPSQRAFRARMIYDVGTGANLLEVARAAVRAYPGVLSLWNQYSKRAGLTDEDRLAIIEGIDRSSAEWAGLPGVQWLLAGLARDAGLHDRVVKELTTLTKAVHEQRGGNTLQSAMILCALGDAWARSRVPEKARTAYSQAQVDIEGADWLLDSTSFNSPLTDEEQAPFELYLAATRLLLEVEQGTAISIAARSEDLAEIWRRSPHPLAAEEILRNGPPELNAGEAFPIHTPGLDGRIQAATPAVLAALEGREMRSSLGAVRFLLSSVAFETTGDCATHYEELVRADGEFPHPAISGRLSLTAADTGHWRQAGEAWAAYAMAYDELDQEMTEPMRATATRSDEQLTAYVDGLLGGR